MRERGLHGQSNKEMGGDVGWERNWTTRGVVDRLDFAESLTLDVLEENMKEIRAECDKVAKQQEYWRQKVIAYQLKLDQMTSREKGVSFHELVARDAGQATDTHQELKQTDFSWEITG